MSNISIPTTVEAQIRTRARNLPIDTCFLSKDWEKSQEANIIITRKHTNGNLTAGIFRVDLKLRGIMECTYRFNETQLWLDDILKRYPNLHEECEYNLAHNIIYAAWTFAKDYGFEPHKNFKTAQFILEEDTDDIPLIEIPLGKNGIPVLEIPFGEECQREIAILKKTAGADFRIVYLDKDGQPEPQERTYTESLNEAFEIGFDKFIEKYSDSNSFLEYQVITDLLYVDKAYSVEEQTQIDIETNVIIQDPRLQLKHDQPEDDHEEELAPSVKYFEEGKTDKAIVEFRKLISKYPDDPYLWSVFLHNLAAAYDIVDEETVKEAYSRFPDHPVIKAWYAEWLAQEKQYDGVFTFFNHAPGLNALTQEDTFISFSVLPSFCFAYAMAWLDKKEVMRAEPYYQIIVRFGFNYGLGDTVQKMMVELKREKLNEMLEAGLFGNDEPVDE